MVWIEWAVSQGFSAVKFHCWNVFEKDRELARAARARFPDLTFMLDVENNYSYSEAVEPLQTTPTTRVHHSEKRTPWLKHSLLSAWR